MPCWHVLLEIESTPKKGWGGTFHFTGFQGSKSVQMFELFLQHLEMHIFLRGIMYYFGWKNSVILIILRNGWCKLETDNTASSLKGPDISFITFSSLVMIALLCFSEDCLVITHLSCCSNLRILSGCAGWVEEESWKFSLAFVKFHQYMLQQGSSICTPYTGEIFSLVLMAMNGNPG